YFNSSSALVSLKCANAIIAFLCNGFSPRQNPAKCPNFSLNSRLDIVSIGRNNGFDTSGSGSSASCKCKSIPLFFGQTAWQVSQPYTLVPIVLRYSSVRISLVCVKKARHLWAFNRPASTSAPVGQASRHIRQSPQLSSTGLSGIKGILVIISPK